MGRREQLEAELVLLDAEERWTAAKDARRKNETKATLKEYTEARDNLTAVRADFRANRPAREAQPGDAVVKAKTVSAKSAAHKGA